MTNYLILILIILGLIYIVSRSLGRPMVSLFSIFYQGSLGAFGIYLFNLLGQFMTVEIPLNPFNALIVGLLMLLAARYLIKI